MLLKHKSLLTLTSALALLAAAPAYASSLSTSSLHLVADDTQQVQGGAERGSDSSGAESESRARAENLLDRNVTNASGEEIGEVEAVVLGANGEIKAVVVGVGGFLGIGERSVAIDWQDVQPAAGNEEIIVSLSREQLERMPEYRYPEGAESGGIFHDNTAGSMTPKDNSLLVPKPAPAAGGVALIQAQAQAYDEKTEQQSAGAAMSLHKGAYSLNRLLGAAVVNGEGQTIGEVTDVLLKDGKADGVVLTTGQFFGIGGREVRLSLNELKIQTDPQDPEELKVTIDMSQEQLKALPPYDSKADRATMR